MIEHPRFHLLALMDLPAEALQMEHDPQRRRPISPQQEAEIEALCAHRRQAGMRVERLPLYDVFDWREENGRLVLHTGQTDYGACLARLAHGLGVCAVTWTPSGVMLEHRSREVAEAAGFYHVKPAGHAHPPDSPEYWIRQEAWEELGVRREAINSLRLLALVQGSSKKFELIYTIETAEDVRANQDVQDAWEADQVIAVPGEQLLPWVRQNQRRLTDPALAALIAAGWRRFGYAWVEEACR